MGAFGAIVASGAVAGFVAGVAGGLLNGATLGQSMKAGFKGALWGTVSSGVANGIGTAFSGTGAGAASARFLAHGLTRAAISKAQGGKYSEGFWSGFASSALGGIIGKAKTLGGQTAMAAIVGGTASKLGGGKFANGAVSGAFVHMYNHMAHQMPNKRMHEPRDSNVKGSLSMSGGVHIIFGGVFGQYDAISDQYTLTFRLGLGMYIGGGVQVGLEYDSNLNNNVNWAVGVGGDIAFANAGAGGQIAENTDSLNINAGIKSPYSSLGIGASVGLDASVKF